MTENIEYDMPLMDNFSVEEQEDIKNGNLPTIIQIGAWRLALSEEHPDPRHVKEIGGESRIPTRLYGPSENSLSMRNGSQAEGIKLSEGTSLDIT